MDKEKDSAFLYADDLVKDGKYAEFKITIAEVVPPGGLSYANKRKTSKPTLRFARSPKGWEMPKTQVRLAEMFLGKDHSQWAGQQVTLYAALTRSPQGDGDCPAIRLRAPIPASMIPIGIRKWIGQDLTGTQLSQ